MTSMEILGGRRDCQRRGRNPNLYHCAKVARAHRRCERMADAKTSGLGDRHLPAEWIARQVAEVD
jgi:hypothetical protein